jgi:chemotaxis protein CheX
MDMNKMLDVKYINPFLQSTITIFQSVINTALNLGKPAIANLQFSDETFIIQIGVTGNIRGQMFLVLAEENAKEIASKMMGGMPVDSLDDISTSALNELCNMIMGNTATIFSTQDILVDITPPISLFGSKLKIQSDIQALKIPLQDGDNQMFSLYLCLTAD